MSKVAAILLALVAGAAQADTLGLHVASWHSTPGYNNVNPGAYWRSDDGLTVGAYCNSQSRSPRFPDAPRCSLARYIGLTTDLGPVSITAGMIGGYQIGTVPMLVPSLKLGGLRLAFLPKLDPKSGTYVVHAMWETEL